jgi:hypothetical protein
MRGKKPLPPAVMELIDIIPNLILEPTGCVENTLNISLTYRILYFVIITSWNSNPAVYDLLVPFYKRQ